LLDDIIQILKRGKKELKNLEIHKREMFQKYLDTNLIKNVRKHFPSVNDFDPKVEKESDLFAEYLDSDDNVIIVVIFNCYNILYSKNINK
jgi:hypothetical protein